MRVFLAAPLTNLIDPNSGRISLAYRKWLEHLIELLRQAGHDVISAHMREDWGGHLMDPRSALKHDAEGIRGADVMVAVLAFLDGNISPGVQQELGIAYENKKPTLLVTPRGSRLPYLNTAMLNHPCFEVPVTFDREGLYSVAPKIVDKLAMHQLTHVSIGW